MSKYGSPARIRILVKAVSRVQGRRDDHYTTGEPTVTADEIAQLILITSLRSRGRSLNTESLISHRRSYRDFRETGPWPLKFVAIFTGIGSLESIPVSCKIHKVRFETKMVKICTLSSDQSGFWDRTIKIVYTLFFLFLLFFFLY